jgi:hypothetical protein
MRVARLRGSSFGGGWHCPVRLNIAEVPCEEGYSVLFFQVRSRVFVVSKIS